MSDLKQDILSLLPNALDRCDTEFLRSVLTRLQRATVTEPGREFDVFNTLIRGRTLLDWIEVVEELDATFLPRVDKVPPRAEAPPPVPTDTELRERLQAALPGWEVGDGLSDGTFYIKGPRGFVGYPSQAALRKPGGIEACARALRVLAGVEE